MKRFNTAGTCFPTEHYMVDIHERVQEIASMVERGDYFCINRGRQYGKTTTCSYGCHPNGWNGGRNEPQSDIYVYRMTMTNEDGDVVEYTPDFMRYRCEQMGVKCVQVFEKFIIPDGLEVSPGEYVKSIAEKYYDGPDPVGKTHVREGVVCRIVNRPKFAAYKHKNFAFKCLEGIVKADAEVPDMEEAQDVPVEESAE